MNKPQRQHSIKDSSKQLIQLEIEENNSDCKSSKMKRSGTLAQRIPKLPDSKFFPPRALKANLSANNISKEKSLEGNFSTQTVKISSINNINTSQQSLIRDSYFNYSGTLPHLEKPLNGPN